MRSELSLHAPGVDGAQVPWDAPTLERALSHLLEMVLRHAGEEPPTVSLAVEGGRTVLTVRAADAAVLP